MDYMTMNFNRNGGGGTSDYSALRNKPSINDVTLTGNKTASDLGLMPTRNIDLKPIKDSQNFVFSGGVYEADEKIKSSVEGMDTVYTEDGTPVELPSYDVIQETEMQFVPTQDLHGYDKPWAGGAGKNKWNGAIKNGYIYNGTYYESNDYWCNDGNIPVEPNTTYIFSGVVASGQICCYDANNQYTGDKFTTVNEAFTTPSNCAYISLYNPISTASNDKQLEQGSTATSYEPYANICPISGQNNATLTDEYDNKYIASLGGTYYGGRVFFETSFYNQFWEYIASYNGETLPREWISDRDEYTAGTTPTIGAEVAYRLDTTIGHRISVTRQTLSRGEITYNGSALYISYQKDNVIGECKKFTIDEIEKYKPFNYSTQEQVVGKWIDGKPIYQKTINLGELPNESTKTVPHGISNFDHIIGLEGYAQTSTASISIPYVSTNSAFSIVVDLDATNITVTTGSDRSNLSGYLTMRYTKTTD